LEEKHFQQFAAVKRTFYEHQWLRIISRVVGSGFLRRKTYWWHVHLQTKLDNHLLWMRGGVTLLEICSWSE